MRYRSQLRGINCRKFSIKRAPIIPAFAPAASITSNRQEGNLAPGASRPVSMASRIAE
jgi:hypothetical protein